MKIASDAAIAVLLLAVGMLLGLAAATDTDAESWLKHWDTLVAGILAVIAAAVTVLTMMKIDAAQQRRHDDLLKMNMRADRLKAERAAAHAPAELLRALGAIQGAATLFMEQPTSTGPLETAIQRIRNILIAETVIDVKPLFGGDLAYDYENALSLLGTVNDLAVKVRAGAGGSPFHDFAINNGQFNMAFRILTQHLQGIASGLEGLYRNYS